jgi:hypothetical protein
MQGSLTLSSRRRSRRRNEKTRRSVEEGKPATGKMQAVMLDERGMQMHLPRQSRLHQMISKKWAAAWHYRVVFEGANDWSHRPRYTKQSHGCSSVGEHRTRNATASTPVCTGVSLQTSGQGATKECELEEGRAACAKADRFLSHTLLRGHRATRKCAQRPRQND